MQRGSSVEYSIDKVVFGWRDVNRSSAKSSSHKRAHGILFFILFTGLDPAIFFGSSDVDLLPIRQCPAK